MIISKTEYDRLNARCIELSRQLRDTTLSKMKLEDSLDEIKDVATRNTYGNTEVSLRKIKELVQTAIQTNSI